jgi:DNA topoisomerase-1
MAAASIAAPIEAVMASPIESASEAQLTYVTDSKPGISRVAAGRSFRYYDAQGQLVRDPATLARIRSLVIPPAWKNVWICASSKGHLQATGRDARGRKQYRYHPLYRQVREEAKYGKMIAFGKLLPRVRRRVRRDLKLSGLPADKVLATVVRLMDIAQIRVGNEEYARENHSYGLTTMRNHHVRVNGSKLHFQFKGKSGKVHAIDLEDRQLAKIVKRSKDLPGYELFQYLDEKGENVAVESDMVNRYLREITGTEITAKDFRTWHGTVSAAAELKLCGAASSDTETKRNVVAALKTVAGLLGNRPATCRKHYVHPAVLEFYESGKLDRYMNNGFSPKSPSGLYPVERCVLKLLEAA